MKILIPILTRDAKLDYRVYCGIEANRSKDIAFGLEFYNGYTVDDGRNQVLNGIEGFVDYVFWIDDDIVIKSDTLKALLENNTGEYPITAMWYTKKLPPYEKITTGMGCMLVKADVLRKMRDNGFRFKFTLEKGEDEDFIEKALEAGYKTKFLDVQVGHLHTVLI